MIDIKLIRENKELVKENIKKKFQDEKIPLVDEVEKLDEEARNLQAEGDNLKAEKNKISKEIGIFMQQGNKDAANEAKQKVLELNKRITEIDDRLPKILEEIKSRMMRIPNIIDSTVPIGKDDSENVEIKRFGEAKVPNYEIPYNADILESINGLDKESAGRTSGNGFYYLMGDAARLVTAMINYARDYMIDKNFIYCIPPFMIRSDVVNYYDKLFTMF